MRILMLAGFAICALALAVTAPMIGAAAIAFPAIAQEANSTVNFDPFIAEVVPYLMTLLAAIVTAAIAWASKKLNDWTGIQIEARHREALQSALLNGARSAVARNLPQGINIDVKSVALKEGIDFVLKSVPDAVRYFGLTPADIERHLIPKLAAIVGEKT